MSRSERRDHDEKREERPNRLKGPEQSKSSAFDAKFLGHIGGEIIVIGGAFFFLWKQIQDLKTKVDPVYTDNTNIAQYLALVEQQHAEAINTQLVTITDLRTKLEQLETKNNNLTEHVNRLTASHNTLANAFGTLKQDVHRLNDAEQQHQRHLASTLATSAQHHQSKHREVSPPPRKQVRVQTKLIRPDEEDNVEEVEEPSVKPKKRQIPISRHIEPEDKEPDEDKPLIIRKEKKDEKKDEKKTIRDDKKQDTNGLSVQELAAKLKREANVSDDDADKDE